jgi:hypothetical protein
MTIFNEGLKFQERNKTKYRYLFGSQNKRNFAKQFFVSLSFVFRETKKRMRNENPNAVGPYTNNFRIDQNDGEKLKFQKINVNMLLWD